MDWQAICKDVSELAKETGNWISGERNNLQPGMIETKGLHNFVTYVDKQSEEKLVGKLKNMIPGSECLAEEQTTMYREGEYTWIIDPLDGTTNFIHGLFPVAISIALMHKKETVLGVIYEIGLKECFYAWKDGQAQMNGRPIYVSEAPALRDSLIATGFPYYDFNRMNPYLQCLEELMKLSHGIRRIGSAATDLAYVACGRFEAFYEYSLSPWDVAAGTFIVQQAGGRVSDFSGGDHYIFGKEIIATNNKVYDEFLRYVKENMNR